MQWTIRIDGAVQGVFFRVMVQKKAQELGLTGTVKNCDDQSVLVVIEGSKKQFEAIKTWINTSPGSSSVTSVQIRGSERSDRFDSFSIIY